MDELDYPETVEADFQPIATELMDSEQKLKELDATVTTLEALRDDLLANGASRQLAIGLEALVPGTLPAKYPINSFTEIPGNTNLKIAQEGLVSGILTTIVNAIKLIFKTMRKAVAWTVSLLRSTKDSEKATAIAGAQAMTASNAAVDMASKVGDDIKGQLLEVVESSLVKPLKDQTKALTDYLLNPEYTDQDIADLKEALYLICDEVNGMKSSSWIIFQILDKFKQVLDDYYKHGKLGSFDAWAPSDSFLEGFAMAASKIADGQYVFNLARPKAHSFGLGRNLSSGFYDAKKGVEELNDVLTKLIDGDVKNLEVGWFSAENWLNPSFVQNFAAKVSKATNAIVLNKNICEYLDNVDKRVDELERSAAIGIGDFTSDAAKEFLTNTKEALSDFNVAIHKLLEILALMRSQQDNMISVLRTVERGQAKVIAEIIRLAPAELSSELKKTFNIHKTAHAAVRDMLLAQKLNANAA